MRPASATRAWPRAPSTTCCSATGWRCRRMRAIDPAPQHGIVLNLAAGPQRGRGAEPGRRRWHAARSTGCATASGRSPSCGPLPRRRPRATSRRSAACPSRTATSDVIAEPPRLAGHQLLQRRVLVEQPGGDPAQRTRGRRTSPAADPGPDATDMGWPVTPDGLRDLLVALQGRLPELPPDPHHRERRRLRRPRSDDPSRRHRRTSMLTFGRSTRPSTPAWTCAATSSGRSWTTSSGRRATPCASASSTSTSRRRSGRRATAPAGTATSSPATAWGTRSPRPMRCRVRRGSATSTALKKRLRAGELPQLADAPRTRPRSGRSTEDVPTMTRCRPGLDDEPTVDAREGELLGVRAGTSRGGARRLAAWTRAKPRSSLTGRLTLAARSRR